MVYNEDVVSRKKIEKLKKWRFSYDTNTTIPKSDLFVRLTDIRDLPFVVPTQRWTTTPPTENIYDILLSAETEYEEPHVWIGFYEDGHYYYINGIVDVDDEVKAWMPLPSPYEK